ncbi:hypothetical protein EMPS_07508 [Entomortierella parvispora]|uniref:IBR domain-containing protein n=1 Tax=Entomortierella parvispora TaxID=205924 RepID=A0A9P3HE98_9FUNG|nr:hypothetical protein EMPS_07508 [Entomortierella parvispora]
MHQIQVFIRNISGSTVVAQLPSTLSMEEFIEAMRKALGFVDRNETKSFRYVTSSKPLPMDNEREFDKQKQYITNNCNIFVLGRLLGGFTLPAMLEDIVKQELASELDKVPAHSADCAICLENDTDCLKACCVRICREDFQRWLLEKRFKVSCMVCTKAIEPKHIFVTPAYVATIQAFEEEKQILQNIDCQRCLECNALMHNETMHSLQTCVKCHRQFCFFCNREWDADKMLDRKNSCGKECVYETMISFQLLPFHYNRDIKIPNVRTCPRCFNFGNYDNKCKYHSCSVCKLTFCFLCLEDETECKRKYNSRYDHVCVKTPVLQNYSMFPRLIES